MKTIPLTKGKVAIVDDDDYEWLIQYSWRTIEHKKSIKHSIMLSEIVSQ